MGQGHKVIERLPTRWAADITGVLNRVQGNDHFPIRVAEVAREYSYQVFPEDPITLVQGASFSSFDGALLLDPKGEAGWGIFFNNAIESQGRINFTLAHEFGHYLIHRLTHPNGMRCSQQDVVRWESDYRQLESEANSFAAALLMPFDDYRRQIDSRSAVDLEAISHCANRYEVSLIAATRRWLEYTERRAVLVVSRDGFILWARSSEAALRTRVFFRTSKGPVPIPDVSVAACRPLHQPPREGAKHPPGVWFVEPCTEMAIFSENYDFTISLLQLPNDGGPSYPSEDGEPPHDLAGVIGRNYGL